MALENRLDLKLSQRLILTPQLQMAIKLLQMPQLELAQTLNNELLENPFLEDLNYDQTDSLGVQTEEPIFSSSDEKGSYIENFQKLSIDEYFEERGSDGKDLGYFTPGVEDQPSFEAFYIKKPDLYEHLLWQLRLCHADDLVRKAAEAVIGNIDEGGYIRASEEDIAASISVDVDIVRSAIKLVQDLDPPGVGARDLKECLLLQLKALNLEGTLVEKIVENNLEDLQKKRYSNIEKQYNCCIEDVIAAIKIIERLEPRPGNSFSSTNVNFVAPDVFIVNIEGEYHIRLNDEHIPKIGLNRRLILTSDEKEYLKKILTDAMSSDENQDNKDIYEKLLKKLSADKVNLVFSIKEDERKLLNNVLNNNIKVQSGLSAEEKVQLIEKILESGELSVGEKNFLKEKFRLANELIDGLDQRNKTIYKVTESILKFQREFFDKGVKYLKPLNLTDVASDINMHESTISRVTSNKYLACDHGIFSFKFFFSSALKSDNGNVSSTSVKDLIKNIIAEEDPRNPYSDQKIAEMLNKQNIVIARRTVAKYREELKIPPQNQRKRII